MALSQKKIAVIDFDIPQLLNNKIFNPEDAYKVSHTLLPFCFLYEQAKSQGIELVTPDIFLNLKDKPTNALMVSSLVTPFTEKLIAAGAKPLIIICLESPFIATRFYLGLKKYSSWFKYSIMFSGMQRHLSAKTFYSQMFMPSVYNPENFKPLPFSEKKYITMISGNKRIGNWKKDILLKLYYGLNVREIYGMRQEVINFFADTGRFDLYGTGWNRGGRSPQATANINKVYRGLVDDKLPVLSQYKFTFCFENSVFPGYLTEKIFDAMFAGSVPVYLGAPDILQLLPHNTFVDMSNFKSLKELDSFLCSMTEEVYMEYMENIKKFLESSEYKKYDYKELNNQILGILQKEFLVGK